MAFASSSRVPKAADTTDKEEETAEARANNIRDKFFKEREEQRKNGALNGRRPREEGEGWTNVRGRKASFSEEAERPPRIGGRFNRDADGAEAAPRRNGARGRFEQPWGRDAPPDAKEADGAHGSWRERRDNREREWARGGRVEEDPEWMDTPVKKKDDIGMGRFQRTTKGPEWFDEGPKDDKKVHTQEDFQRWKEKMKAGTATSDEKENTPEPAPARDTPTSSKPITPMVLDGKDMFGMWGVAVKQESPATTEGAPAPPKQKVPAKQSKFAKLFTPQEEQSQQPQQPQQPPPSLPMQEPNFGPMNGNSEDKEGFQRILQMLGGTSIATQSPSQGSAPSRKPSLFSPLETRSPDRDTVHVQPQPTRHHMLRSREEKAGFIESVLAPRGTPTEFKGPGAFGPFTPAGEPTQDQLRHEVRPESIRSPEERLPQSTPGSGMNNFGIQGLIGSHPPPPHAQQLSRDREFLLNLMTQPQRNTPPQAVQSRPPPPELFTNFMDVKGMPPRANPPPGLFEDRQFPENDVRYQPQPQPRRMPENPEIENALRRANRFNLPVHLDDPAITGLQRRSTGDAGIPRGQMANMGIPQQPPPEQMWAMKPPSLQQPQDRPPVSNMAPPPGFPAANNMAGRGPPGFGGPTNMPPFSAGNTPLGHPGMGIQRGPPGNGPASAGPGGPAIGMFSPQNHGPPHGYFGPPPPGPPPPPGFGGPGGPMGMGAHHEQMQQMIGLRGGAGGPPPGMGGMGGMGMPGQRGIPGGGMVGQGPGVPGGFDHFFENQRRGSHIQGPPFGI